MIVLFIKRFYMFIILYYNIVAVFDTLNFNEFLSTAVVEYYFENNNCVVSYYLFV